MPNMKIAFLTPEYITPTSCDGGLADYLRKASRALAAGVRAVCVCSLGARQGGPVTCARCGQPKKPSGAMSYSWSRFPSIRTAARSLQNAGRHLSHEPTIMQ